MTSASFDLLDQICGVLLGVGALLDDPVEKLAAGDPEEGGVSLKVTTGYCYSLLAGASGGSEATVSQQEKYLFQKFNKASSKFNN